MTDTKEILEQRVQLLSKAKKNPTLQLLEIEACRRDILYFFKMYLYTEKNNTIFSSEDPSIIPFVPFEFQEEYITEVWESIMEGNKPLKERTPGVLTNVFVEKSRQMGISWLTAAIFVYGFVFHKHKYTVISRTEEEVDTPGDMDSIFEKMRFMLRNLPDWMIPDGFCKELGRNKTNVFRKISDPNSEASITGKTANPDAGRGGTRNAIFMDEMAFMSNASAINKSAGSNSPCLIYNSTPNGEGNEFYRMRKLTLWRTNDEGEKMPPEIKGLRYHWTEHPLYDNEWYKWKTQGKTKEQIAQEYEIDYNTAIVGRVYPDFPTEAVDVSYDMTKPLYVAMDNSHGGADPNSIVVLQPDGVYINIIDAIELHSTPEQCAEFLTCQPTIQMTNQQAQFLERYKTYNWRKAIFISDPYDTKSALGNSTILDDYRKQGINLMLPQERSKQEQILKTRTNIYRIRYNENCLDFASAILNSKYPERKEDSNSTRPNLLPVHNWTSHARTALEYFITYWLENPPAKKKEIIKDTRPIRDKITGKLIYL